MRVADIDGERKLLRIEQGKGAKDRLVPLSPTLLDELARLLAAVSPAATGSSPGARGEPLSPTALQKAYTRAKRQAGVTKVGGIHGLRHAYATHQLAAGLKVERLQRLMGHSSIQTTLRYVHWLPSAPRGRGRARPHRPAGGEPCLSPPCKR